MNADDGRFDEESGSEFSEDAYEDSRCTTRLQSPQGFLCRSASQTSVNPWQMNEWSSGFHADSRPSMSSDGGAALGPLPTTKIRTGGQVGFVLRFSIQ